MYSLFTMIESLIAAKREKYCHMSTHNPWFSSGISDDTSTSKLKSIEQLVIVMNYLALFYCYNEFPMPFSDRNIRKGYVLKYWKNTKTSG